MMKSGSPKLASSSSVGRILKPASIAFDERRAFSGLVSHSAKSSFWTSLSPRRKSSSVTVSFETR